MWINLANINFQCPYCEKQYKDDEDKYLDKCNRNKSGYTSITCECGEDENLCNCKKQEECGYK